MRFGEVLWMQESDIDPLLVFTALISAGLSPENRDGERMYLDDEGEQRHWDEKYLKSRWASGKMVAAQFWISDSADVAVSADPVEQHLTVDLSGITRDEARRIVFCVLDAATQIADRVSLVSDLNMEDYQDDWVDYVRGRRKDIPYQPDMRFVPGPDADSRTLTIKASSFLGPTRPQGVNELQS